MSEAEAVWFGGVVARIWFYGAFPALLVVSFVKFRNHDGDDDTEYCSRSSPSSCAPRCSGR